MSEDKKEQAVDKQKPSEEMSEEDLKQVAGGRDQDITVNKAKTADKAYTQMDAYIKQ